MKLVSWAWQNEEVPTIRVRINVCGLTVLLRKLPRDEGPFWAMNFKRDDGRSIDSRAGVSLKAAIKFIKSDLNRVLLETLAGAETHDRHTPA